MNLLGWLYWFTFNFFPPIMFTIVMIGVLFRIALWFRGGKVSWLRNSIGWSNGKEKLVFFGKFIVYSLEGLILDLIFFRKIAKRSIKFWAAAWPMHFSAGLLILSGIHHAAHTYFLGFSANKPITHLSDILPLSRVAPFNLPFQIPGLPIPQLVQVVLGIIFFIELFVLLMRRLLFEAPKLISETDNYFDLAIMIVTGFAGLMSGLGAEPVIFFRTLHGLFAQLYFLAIPFTFYTHIFGAPINQLVLAAYKAKFS